MIPDVTLFLAVSTYVRYIELSSGMPPRTKDFLALFGKKNKTVEHQDMSTQFDKPVPGADHCESSFRSDRDSPARVTLAQAIPSSPVRCTPPARSPISTELHLRARSRSPPGVSTMTSPEKIDLASGGQFDLKQLEFLRLTPKRNPGKNFELRRYTFPVDKPLRKLLETNVYVKMPNHEQIVLSTTDGDVFAVLETSATFSGIYSHHGHKSGFGRVRINMHSREVNPLKRDDIREVPVGRSHKILFHFRIEVIYNDSTQVI